MKRSKKAGKEAIAQDSAEEPTGERIFSWLDDDTMPGILPRTISRRAAAFQVGYDLYALWFNRRFALDRILPRLQDHLAVLSGAITAKSFTALLALLNAMRTMLEGSQTSGRTAGELLSESGYAAFRTVLTVAVPPDDELGPAFDLGKALGELVYHCRVYEDGYDEESGWHPDAKDVIDRMRVFPIDTSTYLLDKDGSTYLLDEEEDERSNLQARAARCGLGLMDYLDQFAESSDWEGLQYSIFDALNFNIDGEPIRLTCVVPRWDKLRSLLFFGSQPVRKVAPQARCIRQILDAYEANNWVQDLPLAGFRCSEHIIDSINKGLKLIKFSICYDENKEFMIRWQII